MKPIKKQHTIKLGMHQKIFDCISYDSSQKSFHKICKQMLFINKNNKSMSQTKISKFSFFSKYVLQYPEMLCLS